MNVTEVEARREARAQSGWSYPVLLWQPRNPAYWVYLWFVINGAFVYVQTLSNASVAPGVLATSITLQALYALPFIWFFNRADRWEREPAKLALLGFAWGGLVSTWLMAAPANPAVISIYTKLFGVDFAVDWGPALTAPFTEETAKLTGVLICVLLARQHVRSAYDGMIIGMFVGLGFQVFENVEYMVSAVERSFNSAPLQDLLLVFMTRSLTGVAGHWLFTAITGAGLGYLIGATDRTMARRVGVFVACVVFAMFTHGLFDAVGALGMISMVISVPILIVGGFVIYRFADRRVRGWMRELLAEDVERGTITEDELDVLAGSPRQRRRHLKQIKREQGKQAAQQQQWVLDGAIELADAISVTDDPDSPQATKARTEISRLRALNT